MIFKLLLEDVPSIPANATLKFNKADNNTRKEIIRRVLLAYNKPSYLDNKSIFEATYKSATYFGLDVSINKFLVFLGSIQFDPNLNEAKLFIPLVEILLKNDINITNPYLFDRRLFSLDQRDFEYVFKLFNILNDKQKIKEYFSDPTVVKINELFVDNDIKNDLKPVGIGKVDDESTIFGTVEKWSTANEPFDPRDIDFEEEHYQEVYNFLQEIEINDLKRFKVGDDLFNNGKGIEIGDIAYAKISETSREGDFYYMSEKGWQKFSNSITKKILSNVGNQAN